MWDGDCGFCRRSVEVIRRRAGAHCDDGPYQEKAAELPDVPVEAFRKAVQLVYPDGRIHSGARAVYGALALGRKRGFLAWMYDRIAPFRWVSDIGYRWVAGHRMFVSRVTRPWLP